MKISIGTSFVAFHLLYLDANAFTIPTTRHRITLPTTGATATFKSSTTIDDDQEISHHLRYKRHDGQEVAVMKAKCSPARFVRTFGKNILDRSDTLSSAGFYDPDQSPYPPVVAGAKTNITLFLLALGYKWYRSIFINKASWFVSCLVLS